MILLIIRNAVGLFKCFQQLPGVRLINRLLSKTADPFGKVAVKGRVFLDTDWPKVRRGKSRLAALLSQTEKPDPEDLFSLLADRARPEDDELPDTGIGLEWERILSSIFIASPVYGTRSSILLMVDRRGRVMFMERVFNGGEEPWMTAKFEFSVESGP